MKNFYFTMIIAILLYSNLKAQNKGVATNSHFSVSENTICTYDSISFVNFHPSNGYTPVIFQTTGYTYDWDFGNGQTSSAENPQPIEYSQDGTYNVLYNVYIDTIGFKLTEITINNFSCDDFTSLNDPDIYIVIIDGDGVTVFNNSSNYVTTNSGPITFYLDILLDNPPYFVKVMDDDSGDANDNCIDGDEHDGSTVLDDYFTMNNETGFGINTFNKTNGGLDFDYTLNKVVSNHTANEIINVYESIPDSFEISINSDTILANITADNFIWYFNNNEISGENDSFIVVNQNGNYYCEAENMNFCSNTSNIITYTNSSVDEILKQKLTIYPNPTSGNIYIKSSYYNYNDYINVYNAYGKLLLSKKVESNLTDIDISDFPSGIYLISYINENNIIAKKIIKQ